MPHRIIIIALLLAGLAGCASAKKSYSEGFESESEGRWAQATEQYIDALRRDPEFPEARQRVYEAGNKAVRGYLYTATDSACPTSTVPSDATTSALPASSHSTCTPSAVLRSMVWRRRLDV